MTRLSEAGGAGDRDGSARAAGDGLDEEGAGGAAGTGVHERGAGGDAGAEAQDDGAGELAGAGAQVNGAGEVAGTEAHEDGVGGDADAEAQDDGAGEFAGTGAHVGGAGEFAGVGVHDDGAGEVARAGVHEGGAGQVARAGVRDDGAGEVAGAGVHEVGAGDGAGAGVRGVGGAAGAGVHGEGVGDGAGSTRSASGSLGSGSRADESDNALDVEPDDGLGDEFDGDPDGEFESFDSEWRGQPFWLRTSTLVVFVVLLFVVSGAMTAWLRISDLQEQVSALEAQAFAGEEARQAATLLAQDLATYDYRDLGGNFRHVAANCTPRFAGELQQLTEELGPELQQSRAVATATVRSAGVVRADAGRAVVAVFVDQTVTNTSTPEPRTERSRMELTLVKLHGAWRLDQAGEL